jgi:hypothetical protein
MLFRYIGNWLLETAQGSTHVEDMKTDGLKSLGDMIDAGSWVCMRAVDDVLDLALVCCVCCVYLRRMLVYQACAHVCVVAVVLLMLLRSMTLSRRDGVGSSHGVRLQRVEGPAASADVRAHRRALLSTERDDGVNGALSVVLLAAVSRVCSS